MESKDDDKIRKEIKEETPIQGLFEKIGGKSFQSLMPTFPF